jgi:Di-haem cytochrome c peroxidase
MMRHPAVIGARSSEQVDGIISAMDFRFTPLEIGEIEPTIEIIWGSFFYIVFRDRNTGTINRERPAPMTKQRIFCAALLGLCGALGGATLLLYDYARADVLGGPLPAPRPPRDTIQLTSVEKLGKLILYDSTLSNPPGYACATCHVAETGYTGPNSEINAFSGPQPGVVPGQYNDRKPQSYLHAAFSPEGPY